MAGQAAYNYVGAVCHVSIVRVDITSADSLRTFHNLEDDLMGYLADKVSSEDTCDSISLGLSPRIARDLPLFDATYHAVSCI